LPATLRSASAYGKRKKHGGISEARLELALEASKAAFFEWDMERSRGKWNSQMTSIYGFTPAGEEITAEEWRSLFHADDLARLLKEADEVYRTKGRFPIRISSGSARPQTALDLIARPHPPGCHGKALQMIGIHADITQQKLAEEACIARNSSSGCWLIRLLNCVGWRIPTATCSGTTSAGTTTQAHS